MRFTMALIRAIASLGKDGFVGLWHVADQCWRTAWSLVPGGGGSGTVMPAKHLDLPDADDAHEAKAEAKDQQRAADYMLSSPERVVQAWARAKPEDRDTISLKRLNDDQIDWLEVRLTEAEIKILAAEKSEFKIVAALAGQEGAIAGVPSVPIRKLKSGTDLSDRISEFRAGGLERPPAYVH